MKTIAFSTFALMTAAGVILTGTQFMEAARHLDKLFMNRHDVSPIKPIVKSKRMRWGLDFMGFTLLMYGTIIWGFGDLPSVIWPTMPVILNIQK